MRKLASGKKLLGPETLSEGRGGGLKSSSDTMGAAYAGLQALVLGKVVAASAREELIVFLQRMPDRTMTAGLITELKKFTELAKKSQLKEIYDLMDNEW